MLSRLTPPLNQHGFSVDAEKTGTGKYGRTGSAPKEKRPEISGLFCSIARFASPLPFCLPFSLFSCNPLRFFSATLSFSCTRFSSPVRAAFFSSLPSLRCFALRCSLSALLFSYSSLLLYSTLLLLFSYSLFLLSLLPVLPPPSQVIGFGPCLRALAERRGFEPLKPFRGLLAFQAGQFNHSCTFPKSKTLR